MKITEARPATDAQYAFVDGLAIFLDAQSGTYAGTNKIGTEIFQFLLDNHKIEDLVGHLLDRYEIGEEVLRRDVEKLLLELARRGILDVRTNEEA